MKASTMKARLPLRLLQRQFAAAVRGQRGRGDAVPCCVPCPAHNRAFTRPARLAVHADGYVARLVEVLASDYPAVRARLTERTFEGLAQRYLAVHPSRHPNLNQLGSRFPAWLRRQARIAPSVVQLARLELALTRAFDAAEFSGLPADALAALSPTRWAKARLVVNPSVQVLRVSAAVADAFTAWRLGQPGGRRRAGHVDLCISRSGERVIRHELPHGAGAVLRRLQRGMTLATALSGLPRSAGIDAWFAQWRADGIFTEVQ